MLPPPRTPLKLLVLMEMTDGPLALLMAGFSLRRFLLRPAAGAPFDRVGCNDMGADAEAGTDAVTP